MTAETISPTAIAKAPEKNPIQSFLEARRGLIAEVAPKHLSPDRLIKVALIARGKDKNIAKCSSESLLKCVIQAAELGLEAGGPQGHAYLVPYGTELTLIVGYRGMLELARRSGLVSSIEAHIIYENDKRTVKFGLDPVLDHEPLLTGDPGKVIAAYAVARLRDGFTQVEVMTLAQLERIRNRSKAGANGPWKTDTEEMYKKTVLRRLCKLLPQSAEMVKATELEDEPDQGPTFDVVATEHQAEPEPKSATEKLKGKVKKAAASTIDLQPEPPNPTPSPEEQAAIFAQESATEAPAGEDPRPDGPAAA